MNDKNCDEQDLEERHEVFDDPMLGLSLLILFLLQLIHYISSRDLCSCD